MKFTKIQYCVFHTHIRVHIELRLEVFLNQVTKLRVPVFMLFLLFFIVV